MTLELSSSSSSSSARCSSVTPGDLAESFEVGDRRRSRTDQTDCVPFERDPFMIVAEDSKEISFESVIGAGGGGIGGDPLALSAGGISIGVSPGGTGDTVDCEDDKDELEEYAEITGRAAMRSCILRARDVGSGGRSSGVASFPSFNSLSCPTASLLIGSFLFSGSGVSGNGTASASAVTLPDSFCP